MWRECLRISALSTNRGGIYRSRKLINNMEKTNWEDLVQRKDIIKIDHLNYVVCKQPKLKYITSLYWDYDDNTLTVSEIRNPEREFQEKEVLDLMNFNYIMLNFRDDGYRRLLKVSVNEAAENLKIENIISPDLNKLNFLIIVK